MDRIPNGLAVTLVLLGGVSSENSVVVSVSRSLLKAKSVSERSFRSSVWRLRSRGGSEREKGNAYFLSKKSHPESVYVRSRAGDPHALAASVSAPSPLPRRELSL